MNKKLPKWWPFAAVGVVAVVILAGVLFFFSGKEIMPSADGKGQAQEDLEGYEVITVEVKSDGFYPENIEVKKGVPTKINFKKDTNLTCITDVVSKDLDILKYLEKGDNYYTVDSNLDPGSYAFNCGMYMYYGKITVN
ncbi:cupredoxin domain-containing protein [Paenibacillus sp. Marseille-Q4541]|uniref:cupredoxin domain-containing protein n=1 Tax=Paenibacillus sp. Marseille-Q4541 TaxID=2831522 RepID=UPI001BAC813E|nr:cupredoxin domain-containing protein [Paenibacillus sp. Marseille-Q4541]